MNRDVEAGKEIFRVMKAGGMWMLPYREFVTRWKQCTDMTRSSRELYEALLLAIHGFGEAGGVLSFLAIPPEYEEPRRKEVG